MAVTSICNDELALSEVKPERARRRRSITKRMEQLAQTALDTLELILNDNSVKAADRISAVKLTFDILKQQSAKNAEQDGDSGVIKVVFEGITEEILG